MTAETPSPGQKLLRDALYGPFAFEQSVALNGYVWDVAAQPLPREEPVWEVAAGEKPSSLDTRSYQYDWGEIHLGWPYHWLHTGPWLVAASPTEYSEYTGSRRRYQPLHVPGLHRRFARLKPEPRAIVQFANTYGWLGQTIALSHPDPWDAWVPKEDPPPLVFADSHGESLTYWRLHIAWLAFLINLWDLVRNEDAHTLTKYVTWRETPMGRQPEYTAHLNIELPAWARNGLARWPKTIPIAATPSKREKNLPLSFRSLWGWPNDRGAIIEPVRSAICDFVNARLRGQVHIEVVPWAKGDLALIPDSLLSALYTLFALEIAGRGRPLQLCRVCNDSFIPRRKGHAYCSELCRKQAFRDRHK